MNLHAISYSNIGPFKNQTISLFFNAGKYLIKSPIGSGKSFLFFDGPMYGLYKYAQRKLLNTQSDSGFIKLWFETNGQQYLIIRQLKQGKNKDACSSSLFHVKQVNFPKQDQIIAHDVDIEDILRDNGVLEEVLFKNETDLQQTLGSFLVPREVFVSTVFLMQDADNIFELLPSERLNVLKNVFGLLGIDEAKDTLANKRRNLQTEIKIKGSSEHYDNKLKSYLHIRIDNYKILKESPLLDTIKDRKENELAELEYIIDKVNIQNFSDDVLPKSLQTEITLLIENQKLSFQTIKDKLDTNQKQQNTIQQKLQKLHTDQSKQQKELVLLEDKIGHIDPEKLHKLKEQKKDNFEKSEGLLQQVSTTEILKFLHKYKNTKLLSSWEGEENFSKSLDGINNFINHCVNSGKIIKEEVNTLRVQKKSIEQELKYKQEKKEHYQQSLQKAQQQIQDFDKYVKEQTQFHCEKIQSSCPFIKQINKKTFEQLEQQKKQLQQESQQLQEEFSLWNKQNNIGDDPSHSGIESNISQIQKQITISETLLEKLKSFLTTIDRKKIKDLYQQKQSLQTINHNLDSQIAKLEQEQSQLDTYKLQKEKIKSYLEHISNQQQELENELLHYKQIYTDLSAKIPASDYERLVVIEQSAKLLEQNSLYIQNLVNDYKSSQIQVLQLKEEEKIVNKLYQIFSKDLLLLILEDSLPTLGEIINTFLGQVVDYQISFFLDKSNLQKLALEAKIYDEKGERDVKSLSGGQRTILKLVWMLAISSYNHSPMLFLDETINNLDQDTVGRVADMLEDFVQKHEVKFYTVTHSQQIQNMSIWDKVLEIV